MAREDFYVSFGSNAPEFGKKLKEQLAPARLEIEAFRKELATLGTGAPASALARLLTGIKDAKGGGPPPPSTGGGNTASMMGGDEFRQMFQDAQRWNAEVTEMVNRLGTLVTGMEKFNRKSQASRDRDPDRGATGKGNSGSFAPRGTGIRDSVRESGGGKKKDRDTAAPAAKTPKNILNTPRAVIDEASFRRVVTAVEKTTSATKDVRRAVERLGDQIAEKIAARGNRFEGGGKGGGGKERTSEAAGKTPAAKVDPERDAAFTRAAKLRAQVADRERLTALNKLKATMGAGEKPDTALVKAAAAGSGRFLTAFHSGDADRIKGRVQKAIDTLQASLAGVPKMRQLQAELADAIVATGTDDGHRTAEYRQVAKQRRDEAKQARAATTPAKQARDSTAEEIRAKRDEGVQILRTALAPLLAIRDVLKSEGGGGKKLKALEDQIRNVETQIEQLAKPLKSERRAANKAKARANRATQPHLPQQDVEQQISDLSYPGNPEMFREMVAKHDLTQKDLVRIAKTFTAQGYPAHATVNSRNPQLIENILAARQAFDAAGGQLAIPLNSKGTKVAPSIRRDTRNFIARVFHELELTVEQEAALKTLQMNTEGGGYVPPNLAGRRSGAVGRASIISTPEGVRSVTRPTFGAVGVGAADITAEEAGENLRQHKARVQQAADTRAQHHDDVTEAAILKAGQYIHHNPLFNPYDPELRAGITGTGPKVKAANQSLNTIQRAIGAWDARQDPHAMFGPVGSPIRAGIELRRQARAAYLEQSEKTQEQARNNTFTARTIRSSAIETMVGATTALGTGARNAAFTRLYPGLAPTRNAQDVRLTDDSPINPAGLKRVRSVMSSYVRAYKALLELNDKGAGSPEELEHAVVEEKRQLHRFIEAYEKAARTGANDEAITKLEGQRGPLLVRQSNLIARGGDASKIAANEKRLQSLGAEIERLKRVVPSATETVTHSNGYPAELGYHVTESFRTYSYAQQQGAVEQDKAQARAERARVQRAGPDEATLKLQAKNARDMARTIGAVTYDQGVFRDRKGTSVDITETVASAVARQKAADEGKRRPPVNRPPELRREFEVLTRPTVQRLQDQLQRAAAAVERHQARINTPDAELAGDARVRLRASVEKQRQVLEQSSATEAQRERATRALALANRHLALSDEELAAAERKRARVLVDQHTAARGKAAAGLAALDPTVRDPEHEAATRQYLEQYSAQLERRDAARAAFQKAAKQQRDFMAGRREAGGDMAKEVPEHVGRGLERKAIYEDYMLSQVPRPTRGRGFTVDDQLVALQRASASFAQHTKEAYDAKRGKAPAGGEPPETGGPAGPGGTAGGGGEHGEDAVLHRILAELVAIHGTLRTGVGIRHVGAAPKPAAGAKPGAAKPKPTESAESRTARANEGAVAPSKGQLGTAAGRARYINDLPDDLVAGIASAATAEERLAAATALVTRRWADQNQALRLMREELKLNDAEAKKLAEDLPKSVQDAKLATSGSRGQEREAARLRGQEATARAAARQAEQEAARGGRTDRARARAMTTVADTENRVTQAARNEIQVLRQLISDGAKATEIAEQQARVYRQLNTELEAAPNGMKTAERRQRIATVFQGAGLPANRSELDDVARQANLTEGGATARAGAAGGRGARQAGNQLGNQIGQGTADGFSNTMSTLFGGGGFASRVMHSIGTFLVRNFSAGLVFGITNAIQDAINQGVQTESTFVRVSQALEQTGRSSSGLRTKLQGLSEDYGVALKDVYETAAGLTGLFDSGDTDNKRLVELTKVAVQLELISGGALNATEAMRSLASITSSYGEETPKHIADIATSIQNELGVNIEETIEGVARLSGQTKIMGIDFAHAATYVASISKFTGQTGAAAGEQFSRMLESIQKGPTQKVISDALLHPAKGGAVDVRQLFADGNYEQVIDTLLAGYKNLSKAQRDQVAVSIGGAKQAASTNALLIKGDKVLTSTSVAYHSNGIAQQRAAEISKQLTAQMSRARAAFVNFFAVLVRTGALNAFGAALVIVRVALSDINHALSVMNDLIDSNPVTRTFTKWALLLGGLVLGFTLAKKAATGLLAVMNATAVGRAVTGGAAATGAAAGAAGAAEGEAAAAAGGGGAAARAGLFATLFGRGGRVRPGLNPFTYTPGVGALSDVGLTGAQLRARQMQAEAMRNAPPGSAMLTPLGRQAVGERFGPVDENGLPTTRRARMLARQSVRMQDVEKRLTQRAESMFSAAGVRAQNLPPLSGLRTDVGAAIGGRARVYAQVAGAGVVRGAGAGAGAMSSAFAAASRNVGLASGAFIGLTVAAGLLIQSWKRNHDLSDRLNQGFQQAWGTIKKETDNPTRAQSAQKYFGQVVKWNQEQFAPDGGSIGAALTSPTAIGNNLGMVFKDLFTFSSLGDDQAREAGLTTHEQDTKYWEKPLRDIIGGTPRAEDDGGFIGKLNPQKKRKPPVYAARLEKLGTRIGAGLATLGEVDKVIAANEKEIQDTADKIMHSGASKAQKANLLSGLANLQQQAETLQDSYRLGALGMNKLDTLTQDQLDAIGPMVQSVVAFGSSFSQHYAPLINAYIDTLGGFEEGSTYKKDLRQLVKGTTTETKVGGKWTPINPDYVGSGYAPGGTTYNEQVPKAAQTPVRTRLMTTRERQDVGLDALKTASDAAQAKVAKMSTADKQDERGQKYIQSAYQLATTYYQAVAASLQQTAADAQASTDYFRLRGNFAGAAASAAAQIKAAQAQKAHGDISAEQLRLQIAQIKDQAAQDSAAQATKQDEKLKYHTRNQIELAQIELKTATDAYNALKKHGGASYRTLQDAQNRIWAANMALADSQASYATAALTTQLDASTAPGDAVAQANSRLTIALSAQRDAAKRFKVNSVEYEQATQGVIDAQRGVTQAVYDVAAANSDLAISYATASGDAIKVARLGLEEARRKLREATALAGGNTNSAEVKRAQAQVVTAQAAYRDAINAMADADSTLLIAFATASGNTVRAANLALANARRKYRAALRKSGGKQTAEVKNAHADVVTAEAAARDAKLQDSLDTIDFNREMGYISAQAAIKQLQALLRDRDLTRAQRRQIQREIHGLQQDLVSQLTSSGFNIPGLGDLKLPSPYEVRRSLGIDRMQKTVKDAVLNSDPGALSLTSMRANTATGVTTGAGGKDIVNAVKAVQTAIETRGASKVSVSQSNHFNVPTAHVAREIARQVIDIINQQTSAQARASTSTPRTVPTR